MKIVFRLLLICFAATAYAEETPPGMYSFADIYRLTVSGTAPQVVPPIAEPQLRVATVQAVAPELRFTIKPVPGPERWWLLLAGLAAAAWVAHRRLTRSL